MVDEENEMTRVVQPADVRRTLERSKSAARNKKPPPAPVATRPYEITVAVLGGKKVGKSALVSQFLWEGFVSEYRPTVEEFNWIEYDVGENNLLMLQVIDSSGSNDFLAMRHLYYKTADAFLVVFSVDDKDSFEDAKKMCDEILELRKRTVPLILVANKRDLYEEIQDWKVKDSYQFTYSRMIPIQECSAKNRTEVADTFHDLLERLRDQNAVTGITDLRKRRQSMPAGRAYSGIETVDIERLQRKQKTSCVIS